MTICIFQTSTTVNPTAIDAERKGSTAVNNTANDRTRPYVEKIESLQGLRILKMALTTQFACMPSTFVAVAGSKEY